MNISAVLVTRGDVDISPVLATLKCCDEVIVWDNSTREEGDSKVFGRWLGAMMARNETVYVQDDDCIVDVPAVVQEFKPGFITANVPPERRPFYSDGVTLVGWGAVFERTPTTEAVWRYLTHYPKDDIFLRECDRIVTGLNRCRNIDVRFEHLPHAHGKDRMGAEQRHLADLAAVRRRIYGLR